MVTKEIVLTQKRKVTPARSLPTEVWQMLLSPCNLSKPRIPTLGFGLMPSFDFENRPDQRLLPLVHIRAPKKEIEAILLHSRRAQRVPTQANVTQSFLLDKKKNIQRQKGL